MSISEYFSGFAGVSKDKRSERSATYNFLATDGKNSLKRVTGRPLDSE
jgi:hypothetical protein